jgi:hypothetical protein
MILSTEQSYQLFEKYGSYITEVCDVCGRGLGPVRFTGRNEPGAWCSRECRHATHAHAPGTCKTCKARLPEGKRRGAMYCDDACKQAAHRQNAAVRTSETPKLSVTRAPIYAAFSSEESAARGARSSEAGSCAPDMRRSNVRAAQSRQGIHAEDAGPGGVAKPTTPRSPWNRAGNGAVREGALRTGVE